jgi:hypothetical protein
MVVIFWPTAAEIGVMQERDRLAGQVHGAGAAQRRAATELGAGHIQVIAQGPQNRRRRIGVDLHILTVDVQSDHSFLLFWRRPAKGYCLIFVNFSSSVLRVDRTRNARTVGEEDRRRAGHAQLAAQRQHVFVRRSHRIRRRQAAPYH